MLLMINSEAILPFGYTQRDRVSLLILAGVTSLLGLRNLFGGDVGVDNSATMAAAFLICDNGEVHLIK